MVTKGFKIAIVLLAFAMIDKNCQAADTNTTVVAQKKDISIKESVIKDRQQLRVDKMTKTFNLTNAQHDQIKNIIANEDKQIQKIEQNNKISKERRESQVKKIRKNIAKHIKKVLTFEQKKKQKHLQKKFRNGNREFKINDTRQPIQDSN